MKHLVLISCILAIIGIFSSCKKDTTTYSIAGNNAPAIGIPADGSGMFFENKVITSEDYNLPVTTGGCIGKPLTKIYTISNTNNRQMAVGTVGFQLTKAYWNSVNVSYNGNNIPMPNTGCIANMWYSVAGPSDTIVFSNFTLWAGSIDSFSSQGTITDTISYSFTDNLLFPNISDIITSGTVSTHAGYTLSAYGAVSGDSVIFLITGPKATISATLGANATSYTFTPARMASVGTTGGHKYGLLQIVPFSLTPQTINGNKYYVLKETCLSKYVILD
jgi:hypothetical protein